ncbi:MAG TPA: class I SAM-dependent methyltransferase [Solirubrobacteraceae bacterium]
MVYSRDAEIDNYRFKTRERVFQNGRTSAERLARAVETETGVALDGRRVLDYGCGVGRLALPLAERCEHVYGLDVTLGVLEEAAANAERLGVGNAEWLEADRLASLSGSYDFVLTVHVLQHIPTRQGERIVSQLVAGLAPGGVGYINVVLRPRNPMLNVARRIWRSPFGRRPRRKSGKAAPRLDRLRVWDLSYAYMMRNSYSLDRLGRLLLAQGIIRWHVRVEPGGGGRAYDGATLIFVKE